MYGNTQKNPFVNFKIRYYFRPVVPNLGEFSYWMGGGGDIVMMKFLEIFRIIKL